MNVIEFCVPFEYFWKYPRTQREHRSVFILSILSEFCGTSQCLKSLLRIILQPNKLLKRGLKAINVPVLHTFNFLICKFTTKISNKVF